VIDSRTEEADFGFRLQTSKQFALMISTEAGIQIDFNDWQEKKTRRPNCFTFDRGSKVRTSIFVSGWKESWLKLVTELGMANVVTFGPMSQRGRGYRFLI
jgi:hypothetical protein